MTEATVAFCLADGLLGPAIVDQRLQGILVHLQALFPKVEISLHDLVRVLQHLIHQFTVYRCHFQRIPVEILALVGELLHQYFSLFKTGCNTLSDGFEAGCIG